MTDRKESVKTDPSVDGGKADREEKLPRRDWIVLPTLSVLTICLLAIAMELTGRWMFPDRVTTLNNCLIADDPAAGEHGVPNSICTDDFGENGHVEYRFNSRGHRAGRELGPKAPGAYRIVMVGSSIGMGLLVPSENSFGALLPLELERATGRNVELYNECFLWETPRVVAMRIHEVLADKPDLILWIMTSFDVGNANEVLQARAAPRPLGLGAKVWGTAKNSDAGKLLQILLYRSPNSFVKRYLMGDGGSGYLAAKLNADWEGHLRDVDRFAAVVETEATAAGVPVAVTLMPLRAQSSMISMGDWPAGFDPFNMDHQLRRIFESHGGTYLDILPAYQSIPHPEKGFFLMDGHPNVLGHATIGRLLAQKLTSGAVPALNADARTKAAMDPAE